MFALDAQRQKWFNFQGTQNDILSRYKIHRSPVKVLQHQQVKITQNSALSGRPKFFSSKFFFRAVVGVSGKVMRLIVGDHLHFLKLPEQNNSNTVACVLYKTVLPDACGVFLARKLSLTIQNRRNNRKWLPMMLKVFPLFIDRNTWQIFTC